MGFRFKEILGHFRVLKCLNQTTLCEPFSLVQWETVSTRRPTRALISHLTEERTGFDLKKGSLERVQERNSFTLFLLYAGYSRLLVTSSCLLIFNCCLLSEKIREFPQNQFDKIIQRIIESCENSLPYR